MRRGAGTGRVRAEPVGMRCTVRRARLQRVQVCASVSGQCIVWGKGGHCAASPSLVRASGALSTDVWLC